VHEVSRTFALGTVSAGGERPPPPPDLGRRLTPVNESNAPTGLG